MVGLLLMVVWVVYVSEYWSKYKSGGVLDSIVSGALFIIFSQKLAGNEDFSKLEKEFKFQVI